MTQNEFLNRLNQSLRAMKKKEREKSLAYYRESIEDRIEDGLSEEQAVAGMEDVAVIAERILSDAATRDALKPKREWFSILLIILGIPVWLSLLVAVGAVLLSVYIVAWSVIISLYSVLLSLAVTALAGCVGLVVFLFANPAAAFGYFGTGLVCAGLAIFLFFPVFLATKWLVKNTVKVWKAAWSKLMGKVRGKK